MDIPRVLLKLIGVILIIFILSQVDIPKVLSIMYSADISLLVFAFVLVALAFSLKILRWSSLLSAIGVRFDFTKVSSMTLGAYGIGLLTPAKAGDFLRAFWASRRSKKPIGQSVSTVFLDRIFDLGALVLFGFLGVIAAFDSLSSDPMLLWTIAGSLFAIGLLIFISLQETLSRFLVERFISAIVPKKYSEKTKGFVKEFYSGIRKCKDSLPMAGSLTCISWIFLLASDYLIARSIGIDVSPAFILIVMPLVFVVELVPISIAGIGTREAALSFLFAIAGFSLEQALAFSFMLFIFNTIFTVAGLIAFTRQ